MITYFGILKNTFSEKDAKQFLAKFNLKFVKYFPTLQIVQFESEKEIQNDIPIFSSVEKQKKFSADKE